ncbi:hypothetical protein C1645_840714 [Glomus cerebriforme]|uniref:Uncharacterized protein n=1 Tax=Glomus cerebriforme TaxID=658196 RepID=A0A397RYX1_9GLOM|nr:hypothetical protein C1645_840714 [Glomus cerebriforme]
MSSIHYLHYLRNKQGSIDKNEQTWSSLQSLMKNDKDLCKEYELLSTWLSIPKNKRKIKNLRIIDKNHQAVFKDVRTIQYNISYDTDSEKS